MSNEMPALDEMVTEAADMGPTETCLADPAFSAQLAKEAAQVPFAPDFAKDRSIGIA